MEMESSRRPFDRSREPGVKKPRLAEELERGSNLNGRPFPQRVVASSGANLVSSSRTRITERDLENEYQPQPPQHQELVAQYKTAIAELTFNSKPIITNLTIIAGENLYAAKAIAATVCANILEVPSEQKLPSLYLLDSIVKNIGRDYIKYFAARLPEVFCKAYRQVDPSVRSSMRHLFGTWKGIFPAQSLQMIEKELRFNTAVNGSPAAGNTVRTDSQSQCQPHSIHVNPKYLERQRLQQSSRAKGIANDMTGTIANLTEDAELDGAASMSSGRSWVDSSVKLPNILRSHRDTLNDPVNEKKIASYGHKEYSSESPDLSRNSKFGIGRTSGRGTELGRDKAWYKAGSAVADTISSQRNGFDIKHSLLDYETLKSRNVDAHGQPIKSITSIRSSGLSPSWKNSEEEEFMWDDMNSGLTDHGPPKISNNSRKDHFTPDDVESLGIENDIEKAHGMHEVLSRTDRETSTDSLSSGPKQLTAFAQRTSLPWSFQDSHSIDGVVRKSGQSEGYASNASVVRMGVLPHMGSSRVGASGVGLLTDGTIGSAGIVEQKWFQSVGAASPSGQLPLHQPPSSPSLTASHPHHQMRNLAEQGHSQSLKTSQFSGGLHNQYAQDSPNIMNPNVQVDNLQRSQPKDLQAPVPSTSLSRQYQAFSQQKQSDSSQSESSDKTEKPSLQVSNYGTWSKVGNSTLDNSVSLAAETSEQSATSSLLAAVMKSGIFSNNTISSSLPNTSFQEMGNLQSHSGVQSPLQSGQPPIQLPSSGKGVPSRSSLGPSSKDKLPIRSISQTRVGELPAPPGPLPPSSTVSSASAPTSKAVNNATNPISNLLSSLVSKGLISAKKESSTPGPFELTDQSQETTSSSSAPFSPNHASSSISAPSTSNEVSIPDRAANSSVTLSQSSTAEIKTLIGFEFKPNKIRELHPHVIKDLYDDLPHCCSICHIRLKLQEQLDRHLQWHALRKPEGNVLIGTLKGWYANSRDLGAGKSEFPSEFESSDSLDKYAMDTDRGEPMVPAEENQCVCVLCGELFEDFYSQERGEWMFKGAVHMNMLDCGAEIGITNASAAKGPIVHAKCISESSVHDLALSKGIKMEQD
ncbi:polyadenylation and cleavage factor-like 4 isoform X1 [Quillaja saponaria]|uniref:Polyadenylation and cleavage factor-like 4 isoform X1 n=1 Tax=Quillaja saponaria TaxID=32244 RepID=A0AAD7VD21_QUISA|nr:polyadenylation and cleavage factor-like 4 isoform X1 [Quillaja saponaria]